MTGPVPGLTQFPDRAALMAAAAGWIADRLRSAIAGRGSACAALSGGTTPGPAYEILAAQNLNWSAVTFALVDERCVPLSHPASNEALLRSALAPALAAGASLASMYAEGLSALAAAANADARYRPLNLDAAVMGMGADAHTASWFPGAAGLADALDPLSTRTVVALKAPQAFGTPERLSLTRAAIARAGGVLLLIVGADKLRTLEAALERAPAEAPVAALFENAAKLPDVFSAP